MLPALVTCREMHDLTLERSQNSGYYSTVLFIFAHIHRDEGLGRLGRAIARAEVDPVITRV